MCLELYAATQSKHVLPGLEGVSHSSKIRNVCKGHQALIIHILQQTQSWQIELRMHAALHHVMVASFLFLLTVMLVNAFLVYRTQTA